MDNQHYLDQGLLDIWSSQKNEIFKANLQGINYYQNNDLFDKIINKSTYWDNLFEVKGFQINDLPKQYSGDNIYNNPVDLTYLRNELICEVNKNNGQLEANDWPNPNEELLIEKADKKEDTEKTNSEKISNTRLSDSNDKDKIMVEKVVQFGKKRGRKPKVRHFRTAEKFIIQSCDGVKFKLKKINSQQNISQKNFSLSEDELIQQLVQIIGPNFVRISKFFGGRTLNMVKNRYYKKLRYQSFAKLILDDSHYNSKNSNAIKETLKSLEMRIECEGYDNDALKEQKISSLKTLLNCKSDLLTSLSLSQLEEILKNIEQVQKQQLLLKKSQL